MPAVLEEALPGTKKEMLHPELDVVAIKRQAEKMHAAVPRFSLLMLFRVLLREVRSSPRTQSGSHKTVDL